MSSSAVPADNAPAADLAASSLDTGLDEKALTNYEFHMHMQYLETTGPDDYWFASKLKAVQEHRERQGSAAGRKHGGLARKTLERIKSFEKKMTEGPNLTSNPALKVPAKRSRADREVHRKLKDLSLHTEVVASKQFKSRMADRQLVPKAAALKREIKTHWPLFRKFSADRLRANTNMEETFETLWAAYWC